MSSLNKPLFSIVTTCFNSEAFIADAIESVIKQKFDDVEHIVTDGASTDGTLRLLNQYDHLLVDSRPDKGIYDGMNRGIELSTGEWIILLNSDDLLADGALHQASKMVGVSESRMIATGALFQVLGQEDDEVDRLIPQRPAHAAGLLFGVPAINARIFHRSVFDTVGVFDVDIPFAADRDWLIRCHSHAISSASSEVPTYIYRTHGGSASMAGTRRTKAKLHADHINMVAAILGHAADQTTTSLAKDFEAVEAAKLLLRAADATGRGIALRAIRDQHLAFPAHLIKGIYLWLKYRARHSDT